MKKYIRSNNYKEAAASSKDVVVSRLVNASEQLSNSELESLKTLTQDMLYQTYENYPDSDEDTAYEITLDHVIAVITEIDEGREYSSLVPFANRDNAQFCKTVRKIVEDHYDEYDWWNTDYTKAHEGLYAQHEAEHNPYRYD